jgi:hypothetical protein
LLPLLLLLPLKLVVLLLSLLSEVLKGQPGTVVL